MLQVYHFVLIAFIALIVGTIGVITGFGGGVLLVPILSMFFGVDIYIIVGSVLMTLFIPAFVGGIEAIKRKEVDYLVTITFSIPAGVGTFVGAYFSEYLTEFQIRLIISILATILSGSMFIRVWRNKQNGTTTPGQKIWQKIARLPPAFKVKRGEHKYIISLPVYLIFGLLVGLLSGFLGISGGWIQSPLFILGFGVPPAIATGTSLLIVIVKSLVGGFTHITEGHFYWQLFLTLAVSLPLGAAVGNRIKRKMNDNHISVFIACSLLLVAVTLTLYFIITGF